MAKAGHSLVINDPSAELYRNTSGALSSVYGYQVFHLDLTAKAASGSSRYNPLARARTFSDMRRVASLVVRNSLGQARSDPFWNLSAVNLLTCLMALLGTQGVKTWHMAGVRHLLIKCASDPAVLDPLFARHASEELFDEWLAIQALDEKVRAGVIATCKAALDLWSDEGVCALTSTDDLHLGKIRDRPVVVFLTSSVSAMQYFALLVSLFFEDLFAVLMEQLPSSQARSVFCLIDEASSLYIPLLPIALANVRKYKCGVLLAVQERAQLVDVYHHESVAIEQNCFSRLYYTGQSLQTAKELEQLLGRTEFVDRNDRTIIRSLMTADEIRQMPENRGLLFCGHHPAIKVRFTPFYKQRRLRELTSLEPYRMPERDLEPPTMPMLVNTAPDHASKVPSLHTTHEEEE